MADDNRGEAVEGAGTPVKLTPGNATCSWLEGRRVRTVTAGTIWRLNAVTFFAGSTCSVECTTARGLWFGAGVRAAESRALPRTVVEERGRLLKPGNGRSAMRVATLGGLITSIGALDCLIGVPQGRGDGRRPMCAAPATDTSLSNAVSARSNAGDGDRRLAALELDCTEDERRTPMAGRDALDRNVLVTPPTPPTPPVPPSDTLLNSLNKRSCFWSCSDVACTWSPTSENW